MLVITIAYLWHTQSGHGKGYIDGPRIQSRMFGECKNRMFVSLLKEFKLLGMEQLALPQLPVGFSTLSTLSMC